MEPGLQVPGEQKITQGWNATWTQTAHDVTAKSLDWNGSLAVGASTGLGFNAGGSSVTPSAFTLNGTPCGVS